MFVEIVLGALVGLVVIGSVGFLLAFLVIVIICDLDDAMGPTMAIVAIVGLLVGGIAISNIHNNETHEGTATGYVTSVERGGAIWKTTGVYLKTDLESTQEDGYCLVDRSLEETLRQAAESNQRVEVRFKEYFWWTDGCEFEDGTTIVSVRPIGGA